MAETLGERGGVVKAAQRRPDDIPLAERVSCMRQATPHTHGPAPTALAGPEDALNLALWLRTLQEE